MRQTDRQTDRHTDSLRTLRNEHEHRSCNSYPSLLLLQRVPCWWCASSCLSGFALLSACHCDRVLCTCVCVCVLTYCTVGIHMQSAQTSWRCFAVWRQMMRGSVVRRGCYHAHRSKVIYVLAAGDGRRRRCRCRRRCRRRCCCFYTI